MLTHLKPEDAIEKKIIYYEDINFDELDIITAKTQRHVMFGRKNNLVFKTFREDYEFKNNVEIAIDTGLYDKKLIPNFTALIKTRSDENRGFVSERFENDQVIDNIDSLVSFNSFKKLIKFEKTVKDFKGPIRLLTHLRYFGHCFNPVSFYYCFNDSDEKVEAIMAEVTNTPWKERYAYVIEKQIEKNNNK